MNRSRAGALTLLAVLLLMSMASLDLANGLWSKSLTIGVSIQFLEPDKGTIGFWKNWDSHNTHTQDQIGGWLEEIDTSSAWLGPTTVGDMVATLDKASGKDPIDRFLGHYLALRLNPLSGLIPLVSPHDVSSIDPDNFLNLPGGSDSFSLAEIIEAIEANHPSNSVGIVPEPEQFNIMKDVADGINNRQLDDLPRPQSSSSAVTAPLLEDPPPSQDPPPSEDPPESEDPPQSQDPPQSEDPPLPEEQSDTQDPHPPNEENKNDGGHRDDSDDEDEPEDDDDADDPGDEDSEDHQRRGRRH